MPVKYINYEVMNQFLESITGKVIKSIRYDQGTSYQSVFVIQFTDLQTLKIEFNSIDFRIDHASNEPYPEEWNYI